MLFDMLEEAFPKLSLTERENLLSRESRNSDEI